MDRPALQNHDTHGKALSLNLNGAIYGTLAEIGAGQEVARWFLGVGAASGTVAKTISAYDKTVSDDIYGAGTRYVSKERLLAMLDREYLLLLQKLGASWGKDKCFFVFADTIAARNYQGSNPQHGWIGVRFQTEPRAEPSQMLLHINLRDPTASLQQAAIGILGVNLIYAAIHQKSGIDSFLGGLFDELSIERIEIDVIEFGGPAFAGHDSGEWCMALLFRKMAHAIVFDRGGVVEPASLLRKRPLLVMRGTFSHAERFDTNLFQPACCQLLAEGTALERKPLAIAEMTIRHVSGAETLSPAEIVQQVRELSPRCPVIASNFPETYLLNRYLRRYSTEPVRFVMSVAAAAKVMHETFYRDLPGTLLEGLGRLFATNVKLYVAPMPRSAFAAALQHISGDIGMRQSTNGWIGLEDLEPRSPATHLLEYLRASGQIVALEKS